MFYYGWDLNECLLLGGADTSDLETFEYYVDYKDDMCVQSCKKESAANAGFNCKELAPIWKQTYKTARECCGQTLWWKDLNACISKSEGSSAAPYGGTGNWYPNKEWDDCVQDCPESSGSSTCGGIKPTWVPVYTSKNDCCTQHFYWLEKDQPNCLA